jgi:predicted dehydrogenase
VVDNNIRVHYHRIPGMAYGATPDYYAGSSPADVSSVWEPEFSLGQLYNKGLFLLGYYGEVNEFARSILDKRQPTRGTLEQACQVTRVFEAFAQGPGKVISLQ